MTDKRQEDFIHGRRRALKALANFDRSVTCDVGMINRHSLSSLNLLDFSYPRFRQLTDFSFKKQLPKTMRFVGSTNSRQSLPFIVFGVFGGASWFGRMFSIRDVQERAGGRGRRLDTGWSTSARNILSDYPHLSLVSHRSSRKVITSGDS